MNDPQRVLLEYLLAFHDPEKASSLFADDGALELPYLVSVGIEPRAVGPDNIRTFISGVLALYPDFRFDARYPRTATAYARVGFRDQVLCTRFTSDGDSGSAVLNSALQVVGMHIAGSESVSIFSKIGYVLSQLGVEVITSPLS